VIVQTNLIEFFSNKQIVITNDFDINKLKRSENLKRKNKQIRK